METQDSLDIAKLQRVALGLEPELPRSFSSDPADIAVASSGRSDPVHLHSSHIFPRDVSPSSIDPLNPTNSVAKRSSSLSQPRRNASQLIKSYHRAAAGKETFVKQARVSGKMDSPEAAPGDTQVVSQSVYDSIIRQNGESICHRVSQTGADEATLRTLYEGDSGHIDLLSQFDTTRRDIMTSPEQDEDSNFDDTASSPTAYNPDFFPESQRFLSRTPGTAVKTHRTPSTSSRTPTLPRNPLAGEIPSSGGMLALSQIFKATQAPSSPLVHTEQLELISDRPSPNLPIQHRRITNAVSSPLTERPIRFSRESSEPNLHYISLKDSQSRRDKSLGERLTRSADNMQTSDELDHEFYKEPAFVENARRMRRIDEETAAQFAALKAPSRSTSRSDTSPMHPATDLPEDVAVEEAGSEEETEQEEDLGPQVPQSQDTMLSQEEDKENYHGPPLHMDATNTAHDRLSQVLATDGHESMANHIGPNPIHDSASIAVPVNDHHSGRSSQVMVQNSQQTPYQSPKPDDETSAVPYALTEVNDANAMSGVEHDSPLHARVHSSPPTPRPGSTAFLEDSSNSAIQAPREPVASFYGTRQIDSNQTLDREAPTSANNGREMGMEPKSSSLPSQVTQTPVHLRPQISDITRITSVPETSPNQNRPGEWEAGSNGHAISNEDDDLPPMFRAESASQRSRPRPSYTQSSPIKQLQAQEAPSQILSSPSGRQRRALTAIAASDSPQIDAKLDWGLDFFTTEDAEFNALIDGSPSRPRKRRRIQLGQSIRPLNMTLPSTPRTYPAKSAVPSQVQPSVEKPPPSSQEMLAVQVPATTIEQQPGYVSRPVSRPSSRSTSRAVSRSRSRPANRSASRANSRAPSRPASRARSRALSRAPSRPPSRRNGSVWDIESPEQSARRRSRSRITRLAASPDPPPRRIPVKFPDEVSPVKQVVSRRQQVLSSDITDVDSPINLPLQPRSRIPESPSTIPQLQRVMAAIENDITGLAAPNQVIAVWQGQKRAYYPGTCFGAPSGVTQGKFLVQFDGTAPVEVVKGAVKRFDLSIGDEVKVDMPNFPKVAHVIRGFGDQLTREEILRSAATGLYPQTDVHGHSTLILASKQRKTLPQGGVIPPETLTKVPISRIYLDNILWNRLKDRESLHFPEHILQETTFRASSLLSSLPLSPNTRSVRNLPDTSPLFANMAFAISYKDDEVSKNRVTRLIREHGGLLLNEGFTELFDPTCPETPKRNSDQRGASKASGLCLTQDAVELGFTCLIADTHSRREKYMQALALNIPCLSGRWVEDCITKGRVLDWDTYLLPAGESQYLNGATRSRVMAPIPPLEARLSDTIASRPRLLEGKSVLVVMGRSTAEGRRKAYVFLTFALGASRVEQVSDLDTAKKMVEFKPDSTPAPLSWDFVYVDDADQTTAKSMFSDTSSSSVSRGRKRRRSTMLAGRPTLASLLGPKVVSSEFICQSLILGQIFED
ncbi:hypothetical protein PDE_09555 [Penicillium oxalicum 114-2]|uniref:BRCT domain-containing protein n=1 Tax=Penicillium oxalicum (strain 114-2 / CGMCC 5302) TaxID=933388 RepID=S8A0E9_PENO1|nr:hypothetical protein PDE_09555 [Penicillium oxalicum 114-2]